MPALEFAAVTKRFGQTVAVNDLSLEIRDGELFMLLGPSGCGKTTCLRLIAGFHEPDAGEIRCGSRTLNRVPPHRRNAAMVFQNYALWPHLTVRGNVEYGLRARKTPRVERDARTREALEMVQLEAQIERYPHELSGGQQQRVALARALVVRPDVLLLDEPLSNLDSQLRQQMRAEIKALHTATGVTAVYVTHDQAEALSIADRVAVLKDGKLQQVGTPREIYRRPATRFVAGFVGETNLLPGVVRHSTGSELLVETAAGRLAALHPGSGEWPEGRAVWCAVRPEAWELTGPAAHGLNTLTGKLEDVLYLGDSEQYRLRLQAPDAATDDETLLKIKVAPPQGITPSGGTELTATCRPEDVVVLAE